MTGFADTYIALTAQAADNLAIADPSIGRRVLALRLKIQGAEAVVEMATGPNPKVALLDLAVMVSIQRQVWHDYWEPVRFKKDALNFVDALERLEREIWDIAKEHLDPQAVNDLRTLTGEIRKQYSTQVFVANIRASRIARDSSEVASAVQAPPSLLAVIGLDPLAGLSPAVAEVTQTRLLAERMFFFAQKATTLAGWRAELVIAETLATPESQGVLANMDEAVKTATRLGDVAAALPTTISSERDTALRQADELVSNEVGRLAVILSNERSALLDGVAAERDALLNAFDERHAEAIAVLKELHATIGAANELGGTLDGLMDEVAKLSAPTPGAVPGRPFDITEYQGTLGAATETLRELNTALRGADELLGSTQVAEGERFVGSTIADLERRAIRVAVIAAAAFGAALLVALSGAIVVRRVLGAKA
ncbi:MAG: hypothetical protein U0575_09030 [Phycisphaerales bacterium]